MMPLASFAMQVYDQDPCDAFAIKEASEQAAVERALARKMHKAIAILQFKLEGQLIRKYPEFGMTDRMLLHRINPEKGTITMPDGTEYELLDSRFPTIDFSGDVYALSPEEELLVDKLSAAFRNCEKLQRHMWLLLDKGGLYKTYNGNLLFHGSIPLNEDGSLREVSI